MKTTTSAFAISLAVISLSNAASTASAAMTPASRADIADVTCPDLRVQTAEYLTDATVKDRTLPAHCLVQGVLEERVGTDGKTYATGFELVATAWSQKELGPIAPKDTEGRPMLAEAYSKADIRLINSDSTAQCDRLDGSKDGILDSAKLGSYDLSGLICDSGKTETCFSKEQADVYTLMHTGAVNSAGEELYAPYAHDAGADFRRWHLGKSEDGPNDGRKARHTAIKTVFHKPGNSAFEPRAFDFDADPQIMANASQFEDEKSADLDAFASGGGKLFFHRGMGDSGPSALDTTRWFDTERDRYGDGTGDFARLYLLPGLGHGPAGIGPNDLTISGGTPVRRRPMCASLTYATWDGPDTAWTCQ